MNTLVKACLVVDVACVLLISAVLMFLAVVFGGMYTFCIVAVGCLAMLCGLFALLDWLTAEKT